MCLVVLVLTCTWLNIGAQAGRVPIGIILAVSGDWSLVIQGTDRGLAKTGQGIPSGAMVKPLSNQGMISISLYDDRILTCKAEAAGECMRPIMLSTKRSRMGQFFAVLRNTFLPQAPVFADTGVRSTDQGELMEAIVRKDHERVDLRPVFEKMRPGRYFIRLVPLKRDMNQELERIAWQWNPASSSTATIPNLTPGLYEIFLLDETKNFEPSGEKSWVLVADKGESSKLAARFQRGLTWIRRNARGNVDAEHTFLRVYLDYLTNQPK